MDHLLQEPKSFREMVEADLRRAGRLIVKVQDEIDPQWRIATPSGDWWLATTLSGDDHGRRSILRALSTFMAWKQAVAFTLASELLEPDCVYCCGVSGSERWAALALLSPEKAADELLNTGSGPASNIWILFAQGAKIPYEAQPIFDILLKRLKDRAIIGIILANMVSFVPLSRTELPNLKNYEMMAAQA